MKHDYSNIDDGADPSRSILGDCALARFVMQSRPEAEHDKTYKPPLRSVVFLFVTIHIPVYAPPGACVIPGASIRQMTETRSKRGILLSRPITMRHWITGPTRAIFRPSSTVSSSLLWLEHTSAATSYWLPLEYAAIDTTRLVLSQVSH